MPNGAKVVQVASVGPCIDTLQTQSIWLIPYFPCVTVSPAFALRQCEQWQRTVRMPPGFLTPTVHLPHWHLPVTIIGGAALGYRALGVFQLGVERSGTQNLMKPLTMSC